MPDPQSLDSYNFQSNPFMETVGGSPSAAQPQPDMAMSSNNQPQKNPMDESAKHEAAPGDMKEDAMKEENQYMKGKNPDKGKPLLSAIQALENYITSSTERDEILTARGIISLLTKLVARDQESMMKQ